MHHSSASDSKVSLLRANRVQREAIVHAFIYEVRPLNVPPTIGGARSYCTVFALGTSTRQAEAIAINCVHQNGCHIMRADTVVSLAATDVAQFDDGAAVMAQLNRYGVSFQGQASPVAA